ncbi:MAG: hypothetical protein Fur0022_13780 [Anaerolineales bacterium]
MTPPLRLASCMSELADPFGRALSEYLGDALRQEVIWVEDLPWQERQTLVQKGEIEIGWMCGLDYVKTFQEGAFELLAAPVMSGARYRGTPAYFTDVVVRRESGLATFEEMRGTRWVYNEPGSFSGYAVLLAHLLQQGEDLKYFAEAVASGAHSASVERVLAGEADGTAVDSTVFDLMCSVRPGLRERLRVVKTLGPNPIPPFVVSRAVAAGVRERLREFFLQMHATPRGREILSLALITHFVAVRDRDYDPIRQVMGTISLSPRSDFIHTTLR